MPCCVDINTCSFVSVSKHALKSTRASVLTLDYSWNQGNRIAAVKISQFESNF